MKSFGIIGVLLIVFGTSFPAHFQFQNGSFTPDFTFADITGKQHTSYTYPAKNASIAGLSGDIRTNASIVHTTMNRCFLHFKDLRGQVKTHRFLKFH